MWRAFLKGSALFLFGRMPGGVRLYRELTRNWMGTQATHVDKLKRVWPGYMDIWQTMCNLEFEGLEVWVHEAGWTPFALLANYLITGRAGVATNSEGRMLDKYLARAVNGAISISLPNGLVSETRRRHLEPLRWSNTVTEAITAVGGRHLLFERGKALELESDSIDVCHSGVPLNTTDRMK
jgi:hypothetical protein